MTHSPRSHLLGNGRYAVMLLESGTGYSHWRDVAITRWREDPTGDDWGSHILLRDVDTGELWSAGRQPFNRAGGATTFQPGRVAFTRSEGSLDTRLDVAVAADRDAEVRCITLHNRGTNLRTVELTSYAELVLGSAAGDAAHPAFAKLFIQTQWSTEDGVLLATRRRRAPAARRAVRPRRSSSRRASAAANSSPLPSGSWPTARTTGGAGCSVSLMTTSAVAGCCLHGAASDTQGVGTNVPNAPPRGLTR